MSIYILELNFGDIFKKNYNSLTNYFFLAMLKKVLQHFVFTKCALRKNIFRM